MRRQHSEKDYFCIRQDVIIRKNIFTTTQCSTTNQTLKEGHMKTKLQIVLLIAIVLCLFGFSATAWGQVTYTWTGATDTTWATSTNWNPNLKTTANTDILVFDGTQSNQPTLSASQIVASISVTGNTTIALNNASAITLTLSGNGSVFTINSGVQLIVKTYSATNAGTFTFSGASPTSTITGMLTILGRFALGGGNVVITVPNGGVINVNRSGSGIGGPVLTSTTLTIQSGAIVNWLGAGSAISNTGTVTFNSGSYFNLSSSVGFSASGKTYGNLTFGGNAIYSISGASALTVLNDLIVSSGSTLTNGMTATTGIVVGSTMTVNGTLNCGATNLITGAGNFVLSSSALLSTANVNGIISSGATGSIEVAGTRTFDAGANYVYNGTVAQVTGNGLPTTVNNLTINNTSGGPVGVALSRALTVNGILNLMAGVLDNSTNAVTLGPSGSVQYNGGSLNTPLPVEMISFTASAQQVNAMLVWSTATEVNNYGFNIERRAIASSAWAKVGFVAGNRTSNATHHYTYADNNLSAGTYAYRLKQIDNDGTFKYSASTEVTIAGVPKELKLYGNYPNPFNPSTKVEFTVPETGNARLSVYNVLGQEVATLFNGSAAAGNLYSMNFDASRMASGLYFSVLEYGNQRITHKMLLTK